MALLPLPIFVHVAPPFVDISHWVIVPLLPDKVTVPLAPEQTVNGDELEGDKVPATVNALTVMLPPALVWTQLPVVVTV